MWGPTLSIIMVVSGVAVYGAIPSGRWKYLIWLISGGGGSLISDVVCGRRTIHLLVILRGRL